MLAELNRALGRDRTRITVNGFTGLGLVEMTRKRTRESLEHVLCEPCSVCGGRGAVKTAQTVCYEVLREILRESRQFNAREFRILASQEVIDLLQPEIGRLVSALRRRGASHAALSGSGSAVFGLFVSRAAAASAPRALASRARRILVTRTLDRARYARLARVESD